MGEIRGSCPEFPDNSIRARERSVVMLLARRSFQVTEQEVIRRCSEHLKALSGDQSRR